MLTYSVVSCIVYKCFEYVSFVLICRAMLMNSRTCSIAPQKISLSSCFDSQGMEIYSTALWHLQKEVVLSSLAQELVLIGKKTPQAWCVAGNCFSLQKVRHWGATHNKSCKFPFDLLTQCDKTKIVNIMIVNVRF